MTSFIKKAGLGVVLAATVFTAAAPAEAQRWRGRGYNRGGGDVAAGAIIGGILGLGVGAAIAGGNRDRYYDRGYYAGGYDPYYAPPPRVVYRDRYYAPPPRVVVRERYYDNGGYYGPGPGYGYYGY